MRSLAILLVLCVALFSTTNAAPAQVQSDLVSTGAKTQSGGVLPMLMNLFGSLMSGCGKNNGEIQSSDTDLMKNLFDNLFPTDGSKNTNSEANKQTRFPLPFTKTLDQNRVVEQELDYDAAVIEAFKILPTEAKAEFFEKFLSGLLSNHFNRYPSD